MKKTNNKGFSLVELIVAIAIMAVLMVVVAPQMLKYVDKARVQRDNSAIGEIANAVKIAMADQDIFDEVYGDGTSPTTTIKFTSNKIDYSATKTKLAKELKAVIGENVELNSATYKKAAPVVTVTIDSNNRVVITATPMVKNDGVTPDGTVADGKGTVTY